MQVGLPRKLLNLPGFATVLCGLLGVEIGRFRQRFSCPVASLSVVEFGAVGPQLLALAERSHLDQRLREIPGS